LISVSAAGQYFEPEPAAASRPAQVELRLPDATITLGVDRGVFSASRIDPGTAALLRAVPEVAQAGALLDLGCGYGPIACTLARRSPATVWAVDVNRRALALTKANAADLGLANVAVAEPDAVPDDVSFAEIWSNPPIRIGKPALHTLLETWLPRLAVEGRARLVIHKHLGGDSLADWLTTWGWAVQRIGSKQGYRLLDVTRSPFPTLTNQQEPDAPARTD
jgi:16S rRNA (guanine1207-N2)-methyltransferase